MMEFQVHDQSSAPEASKPILEKTEKNYGFALNLFGIMAESPAALAAYVEVSEILSKHAALDAREQQVVMLAVSEENGCDYCMAAHSTVAGMVGLDESVVRALRDGDRPESEKYAALTRFAKALMTHRGWVPDDEQKAFSEAGYDKRHVLDVITILGLKTLSNYTNHLAQTPLDDAFESQRWSQDGRG